jgi:hypothetical protein
VVDIHLSADIGGLLNIRSRPTDSDPWGFFFGPEGFNGWTDGAGVRRSETPIAGGIGSFDIPPLAGSRYLPWTGLARASSMKKLGQLSDELSGLLIDGSEAEVAVYHLGSTRTAMARLADQSLFVADGKSGPKGEARARFSLQLFCADPRKFGETRSFAAGEEAFHDGNYIASPVLRVYGTGVSGYTIGGPDGRSLKVTHPIVQGHHHFIDTATRRLTVDGAVIFNAVTGTPWGIPPYQSVVHTLSVLSGSATLSVPVAETWM